MDLEYIFSIVLDDRLATAELFAADDRAARNQALMATAETLKDYGLRGHPLTSLAVTVESLSGETIFEARVVLT